MAFRVEMIDAGCAGARYRSGPIAAVVPLSHKSGSRVRRGRPETRADAELTKAGPIVGPAHHRKEGRHMDTFTARQGDVLIRRIRSIPEKLVDLPLEAGRVVLAHGEVTGHAHVVEGDVQLLAADVEELDERFLRVLGEHEAHVVHEEHGTIALPPGDYVVRRQREYTSADMAPARVAD